MPSQRPDIDPNLRRRAFAGGPTSVDVATGSFDIVISTPSPVVTWVPDPRVTPSNDADCSYIEVDEVLVPNGVDLSRAHRMPLLDSHDNFSTIDKIIGKIENIRIEGDAVIGRATLTRKRRDLIEDIAEGFYGQISAAFTYDIRTDAEFIEREGQRPLVRVFRWLLLEASAVGVGADPRSVIRSLGQQPAAAGRRSDVAATPQEKNMELEELVKAAEEAVDAVVAATDEGASEEVVARAKALRKLRAEGDEQTEEEKAAAAAAAEEERKRAEAEGEEELTAEEEKENEALEASARAFGLTDQVKALRSTKAKPAVLRAFIQRSAVAAAAASAASPSAAEPARERNLGSGTLDVIDIYARANSRFRGNR